MKPAEVKVKLHNAIESMPPGQLNDVYGIVTNYLSGNYPLEDWDNMPAHEQEKTLLSLSQAKDSEGSSLKAIIDRLNGKYAVK